MKSIKSLHYDTYFLQYGQDRFLQRGYTSPAGDIIILVSKSWFLYLWQKKHFPLKMLFPRGAACAVTNRSNVFWSGVYETLFFLALSERDTSTVRVRA